MSSKLFEVVRVTELPMLVDKKILEASLARQANGKLSNKKVVKNLMIC